MNLRLSVSIDDVNPSPQYRIHGTPAEKWMTQLHDEFGVKYTLFIPSCFHRQWPISQHKSWINELANDPKFEISLHGHYHQTTDPIRFGECEFAQLQDTQQIQERIKMMRDEWAECGFELKNMGHRNPGWLCSPESKYELQCEVRYAALHYQHNNGLEWQCETFFGHDGIQQENISIHNKDMIMFTSHIAGKHNHNVWNEQNYEQLWMSLTHLFENYTIEPKFLKECL